jgi:iron(III) transport system ATP-binding protein
MTPMRTLADTPSLAAGAGPQQAEPKLRLRGVGKRYGQVVALRELTLEVAAGEILLIVGPSGCGKSTALRLIAGLDAPDAGEIEISGQVVAGSRWVGPEQRGVGMVFQDYALFPHMSVAQNVTFGLQRWPREQRAARVAEVLELVNLGRHAQRYPHELSGGEQQRVAIARALAAQPHLLLLDEPLSNLDAELRAEMRVELRRVLKAAGITGIMVTHDQEEAFAIADRVAVFSRGELCQVGAAEEIYHAPACRFVADFVGEAGFLRGTVAGQRVLTEIGEFDAGDWPHGAKVEVMLRPTDLRLQPRPDGEGEVVARHFRGAESAYDVRLPSGTQLRCCLPGRESLRVGARVRVEPIDARAVAFPVAEEALQC